MKIFKNVKMINMNLFDIESLNISKNKKPNNPESIKVLKIKLFRDLSHENFNFINYLIMDLKLQKKKNHISILENY